MYGALTLTLLLLLAAFVLVSRVVRVLRFFQVLELGISGGAAENDRQHLWCIKV